MWKVKSIVAICTVLLLGLGLGFYFGSIDVVPVSAQVIRETVEYPFYCTGNVSGGIHSFWGGYVNAPAPLHPDYNATYQPEGFTFSFSIPYFKVDNITEVPDPYSPGAATGILYKDNCTGDPNGIITVNITNNLGIDITIIDLTAEVTDSNMTLPYIHKFAGMKTFAGMSLLGVDPIDPYTDDLLLGYLAAPPRVPSNDLDEHYKNWTGATGPVPGKYSAVYGPTSLRQKSDYPPTDDPTKPIGDNASNLLPPETLADGATYTEYFGAFWGGNATQGANLYGTITLKLMYEHPPIGAPEVSFTWLPTDPKVGDTVTFDASASTADGGTIVSYTWDFGDGTTGTGVTVTHEYTEKGDYEVVLNVTDSEGLWYYKSETITVAGVAAPFPWVWVAVAIVIIVVVVAVAVALVVRKRKK